MDGKAAPGLRGTPPDAVVFGSKVSVRARYLHIIIWNGYEIVRKARSPLGMPQQGMPGRAAHGRNHAGERLACCIVFFPAILWCAPPLLGGDRFSVPHGDSVRHPFGIPGRAGPVLVALRQQAGRAILYHIIFLIMSILYHGKKLRTPSFQCPAYARSAATEWQALVIKKVYNILELCKNKYRLVQKRGGIWCQRRSQKGRREGPLSIPRKTSGATGEKRSHPS